MTEATASTAGIMPADEAAVRVEVHPELGRVLVATKALVPGDLALCELPLLSPAMASVGETGQWPKLLSVYRGLGQDAFAELMIVLAFAQASEEVREEVRRGFYAPRSQAGLADPDTEQHAELAARGLSAVSVDVSKDDAVAVLLARRYNSFAYPAIDTTGKQCDTDALFRLGSKLEHTCRPSVVFKVLAASEPARFVVVSHVAAGERLSVGYVDLTMPTPLRRMHCEERFGFVCHCRRCAGDPSSGRPAPPDTARTLSCWRCGGRVQPEDGTDDFVWRCRGRSTASPDTADGTACDLGVLGSAEIRDRLGMDDLEMAATVAEELAAGTCSELPELDARLDRMQNLGRRHWAVRTLEWHRLKAILRSPGAVPAGADISALCGLEAAIEDGGIAAAVQVGWDGVSVAIAIRLCRAESFDEAARLVSACLPIVRLVYPSASNVRDMAERLEAACTARDPSLLDAPVSKET